jgi:HEAT repeat protein
MEKSLDLLITAVGDDDVTTRLSAVEALERLGPKAKAAVPALRDLLRQPPVTPALTVGFPFPGRPYPFGPFAMPGQPRLIGPEQATPLVLATLGRIGPDAAEAIPDLVELMHHDKSQYKIILPVLANLGPAALKTLLESANNPDADVRVVAVEALGSVVPAQEKAVEALLPSLKDKNEAVREQALFSLVRMGPAARSAVPALIEILEQRGNDAGQGLAAQALGSIGPEAAKAVPALRAALKNPDPYVRQWAAAGLGGIGAPAAEAAADLEPLLQDESGLVRRAAARARARLKVKE